MAHKTSTLIDPTGKATLSYKKVSFSDLQTSYISVGLRFLF